MLQEISKDFKEKQFYNSIDAKNNLTIKIIKNRSKNSSASYDDDYQNYFEDRQECYNGSEQNPEFTNHHVLTKTSKQKEKTLKPDLTEKGFAPEIIEKADEIFSQMESGLKRGIRRKQLMFFCVHEAHNTLRIPQDPCHLAKLCDINKSQMIKAFSMCSPSKTNYKSSPVKWKPKDFIKEYYDKIIDLDLIV
jgi:hypothetical protein